MITVILYFYNEVDMHIKVQLARILPCGKTCGVSEWGQYNGSLPKSLRYSDTQDLVQFKDEAALACNLPDHESDTSAAFFSLFAAMRVLIPSSFLPQFKNPCWYGEYRIPFLRGNVARFYNKSTRLFDLVKFPKHNESRTLHCLPYFYIVGFPRSGTTTLFDILTNHPQFAGPNHKEIHWLTHHTFELTFPENLKSVLRYIYHFDHAAERIHGNPKIVTCDASVSTMWDNFVHLSPTKTFGCEVPLLLSRILPNAKYVVLLRDPVDRLYSEFWYYCKTDEKISLIKSNGPRAFHQVVEKFMDWFASCQKHQSLFKCLYSFEADNSGCQSVKLHASLYYLHIVKWLSVIPREQFFFIKTENFNSFVIKQLFEFLGLEPVSDAKFDDMISSMEYSNLNQHTAYHNQSLLEETRNLLNKFFYPFNKALANLLQDNQYLWNS